MTTTIEEMMAPYISETNQHDNNIELMRGFYYLSTKHMGWRYFNYLLENGNTGWLNVKDKITSYDPQNVIALCKKIGLNTVESLFAWVDGQKDMDYRGLIDTHTPSFSITKSKPISYEEIKELIYDKCFCEYDLVFSEQFDPEYIMPCEADINNIIAQCPVDRYKYQTSSRDCEDFAFMTRSFLAVNGYANLSIPYVSVNCYLNNEVVFAHGINLLIYFDDNDETQLRFFEPQTDKMWLVTDKMKSLFVNYDLKIRYVLI